MIQKVYSKYVKRKRSKVKEEKMVRYFHKEGVYDEVRHSNAILSKNSFSVSVVTAMYNAESDIEAFIISVINQTIGFENNLELILIDDGSTDSTARICHKWVELYPQNIFYYKQENQGVSSARNLGLKKATKEWLSFIDSDDFVNGKYFEEAFYSLSVYDDKKPDIVSCNVLVYRDGKNEISNSHPLSYKYSCGRTIIDINQCPSYSVQLFANSCIVKREVVRKYNILFPDIKPSFEDGYFVNHYMLVSNGLMALSPKSKYFYRKKENSQSLIATSWGKKERYSNQMEGYLALMDLAISLQGFVPDRIQKAIAYDLMWHFKYLVGDERKLSFLDAQEKNSYKIFLKKVFSKIDGNNFKFIESFNIGQFYYYGMQNFISNGNVEPSNVDVLGVDEFNNVKYRCFSNKEEYKVFPKVLGEKIYPLHEKIKKATFLQDSFAFEYIAWSKLGRDDYITFEDIYGNEKLVRIGRKPNSKKVDGVFFRQAAKYYKKNKLNDKNFEIGKKLYRRIATSRVSGIFKECWMLMDRDVQADDNAEHFYQFLSEKTDKNIWFAIRKDSPDWNRLKRKGFKLINYGSVLHKLALLNCKVLLSSHADTYVLNLMSQKHYRDLLNYKFVFLQHGVIKDDLSGWLNNKPIDLFVTSTKEEYNSIAGNCNAYNFSSKEVSLTGLPRHDELYNKYKRYVANGAKRIIIMPTWRKALAGKVKALTNVREYNDAFKESYFFQSWNSLLSSSFIKEVASSGVEVFFFPHANLEPYIKEFNCENVKVLTHSEIESIQDLFVSADLMITDYSSVAFEMAFLEKAVLYFQFDEHSIYAGEHLYSKGYFDYRSDGFGPVASSLEEVSKEIECFQNSNFEVPSLYLERMRTAFPYEKGRACERVYHEIVQRRLQ